MTDFDVLNDIVSILNIGKIHGPRTRGNCKPIYRWGVYSRDNIFKVVCEFYPYLGQRRKEKADQFIRWYSTHGIKIKNKSTSN